MLAGRLPLGVEAVDGRLVPASDRSFTTQIGALLGQQNFPKAFYNEGTSEPTFLLTLSTIYTTGGYLARDTLILWLLRWEIWVDRPSISHLQRRCRKEVVASSACALLPCVADTPCYGQ
jgi:hypothetical protein